MNETIGGAESKSAPSLRIAVLGGSSSGVPVLIEALRASQLRGGLGETHVRLFGRDLSKLEGVRVYCEHLIRGMHSLADTDLSLSVHVHLRDALTDATHVICLVRPGGMSGRASDESLALAAGVPADEGLAVGGLACFLRGRSLIRELAAQCNSFAPRATFLQMSSPLGLNVAVTTVAFGPKSYGICELPRVTKMAVANHVCRRAKFRSISARCAGLNHQSWLYSFTDEAGRDCTNDVLDAIDSEHLLGIAPEKIRDYGAVPMPYLRLYLHTAETLAQQQRQSSTRGMVLARWNAKLDDALRSRDEATIGALLAERKMNWFDEALVPVLEALHSDEPVSMPLNVTSMGSLAGVPHQSVVEIDCWISREGVRPWVSPEMPPKPFKLTQQLVNYERAVLSLPEHPTPNQLAEVVSMHPLTPKQAVLQLARALSTVRPLESVSQLNA